MTNQVEPLGTSTNDELFTVFLVFGTLLGFYAGVAQIVDSTAKDALQILGQTLAPSVFALLCSAGLAGVLVSSWQRTPRWLAVAIESCCLPALRSGLGAGFISSGAAMGVAFGLGLACIVFNTPEPLQAASVLFLSGAFVLLLVWPCFYLGTEIMGLPNKPKGIALFYLIGMATILLPFVTRDYWELVVCSIVLVVYARRLKTRKSAMRPLRS